MSSRAALAWFVSLGIAAAQPQALQPTVRKAVESISETRIAEIMQRLEAFGTRHTLSSVDHPTRGIGAARRWIFDQFKSYSPRLQVRFDSYKVKAQDRIPRDVEVVNVVAVLPGRTNRQVLVTGHYDSLNIGDRTDQTADPSEISKQEELDAPGVSDDASGTAAVMETARVLSQFEFDNTLVFIAFGAEEQMMVGSTLYAAAARSRNQRIDAVLNSDIIGTEVAGNGRSESHTLRVFSEDPADSASRHLARYFKTIAERYVPSMQVQLVFRADRFSRAGDHMPFEAEGFPAIRLTTPNENYAHQHTLTDNFANASVPYTARVTRMKAAVAASLALAPPPPHLGGSSGAITRGKSRYDAVIRWWSDGDADLIAGYTVVYRQTTSPFWEKEVYAGDVNEFRLENVSIDDVVFGVKAIGKNGVESPVATAEPRAREKQRFETIE